MKHSWGHVFLGVIRIVMGLIFLWAFFDKVFGLGFATKSENAWVAGASPTLGFLKFGTHGPFVEFYQSIAGQPIVDWLFMAGLLGVGVAMLFGIGMKIASISGAFMMFLMWTAVLPPENHPFIDEHIVYLFVFLALGALHPGEHLGLGKQWAATSIVTRYPWLR